MFTSGLEYAIIFPTIWEYLQHLGAHKEQTYWLGLVISAMTLSDMASGLIIGRVVDIYYNIRLLVLVLNVFQVGGGIMYCLASSPALLFVARLISGCGKSISVAFLADICRSTSKSERTPVLLLLNISYQIGLMLGPAVNLILEHININISSFTINKLNAPGLVMAVLWSLVTVLVLTLYTDLVKLTSEQFISEQLDQGYMSNDTMENIDIYQNQDEFYQVDLYQEQDGSTSCEDEEAIKTDDEEIVKADDEEVMKTDDVAITTDREIARSEENPRMQLFLSPPPGSCFAGTSNVLSIPAIDCYKARSRGTSGADFTIGDGNSSLGSEDQRLMDEEAGETSRSYGSFTSTGSTRGAWGARVHQVKSFSRSKRRSVKYFYDAERMIADQDQQNDQSSLSRYSEAETTNVSSRSSRNVSVVGSSDYGSEDSGVGWRQYVEYLVRIEIIILIFIRFIVLFCQTGLEAIVPPVMNTIFKFDDTANSYLYLAAAAQFVVMFGVLAAVSRCVSDRALVRLGLCLSVVALIWHTCTIPRFKIGDRSQFKYFGIGVFLQLLGCPVVAEIGLALYSKLLPENVQGFGHGVRRFFSQLAVLLGPLWGASTLSLPLLMTLVPLGMQVLAAVLFVIWYSKMIPSSSVNEENNQQQHINESTPLIT